MQETENSQQGIGNGSIPCLSNELGTDPFLIFFNDPLSSGIRKERLIRKKIPGGILSEGELIKIISEEMKESFWEDDLNYIVHRMSYYIGFDLNRKGIMRLNKMRKLVECTRQRKYAFVTHYDNGDKTYHTSMCRQKYCPICQDQQRRDTAKDYVKLISQLVQMGVLTNIWTGVFTLPRGLSDILVEDPKTVAELRRDLRDIILSALGFPKGSKVGVQISPHLIGDDITRTRLHFHVLIIPVIPNDGSRSWQTIDIDRFDLGFLKSEWGKVLKEKGFEVNGVNHPYMKSISLEKNAESLEDIHKRLKKRIFYHLRSHGKDLLKNLMFVNKRTQETLHVTFRSVGENELELHLKILPLSWVAARWVWLRDHQPRHTPYGWLQRVSTYLQNGYLPSFEDPGKRKVTSRRRGLAQIDRRSVSDPQTGSHRITLSSYLILRREKNKSDIHLVGGKDFDWGYSPTRTFWRIVMRRQRKPYGLDRKCIRDKIKLGQQALVWCQ